MPEIHGSRGLMQNWQLTVPSVLAHCERFHATQTVVSRTVEGGIHSYTYAELGVRCRCGIHPPQSQWQQVGIGILLSSRLCPSPFSSHRMLALALRRLGMR